MLQIEQLLENTGWLSGLARRLADDDHRAQDLLQDAWVAARERKTTRASSPELERGWVAGVVRNLAKRRFREESRRRRREERVARPEASQETPASLVERAELQHQVVRAVMGLDEPYRSTVLLRFFEELGPSEIENRTGVPAATVSTRLHRALARLREELDGAYSGSRKTWVAVVPFLALRPGEAAAAGAKLGVGAGAAAHSTAAQGTVATSSAALQTSGLSGTLLGGIIMQKTILGIGCASALALGLGFGFARMTEREAPAELLGSDGRTLTQTDVDELDTRVAKLEATLETQRKEAASAAEIERDRLLAEIESLEKDAKRVAQAAESAAVADAVARASKALVSFGKAGELEGVMQADWPHLASVIEDMNELMAGLVDNETPDPENVKKIRTLNAELVKYAAAVMGQLPTNTPINGEFTHPITSTNLVAAMLERNGVGLDDDQKTALSDLGAGYEREYEAMQGEYGEDTLRVRKIVDELELKRDHQRQLRENLSDEQLAFLTNEDFRDRWQVDPLSPAISALGSAQARPSDSVDDARDSLRRRLSKNYGFTEEQQAAADPILASWAEQVRPIFEAGPPPHGMVHLDHVIDAGRAQLQALESLLDIQGLSEQSLHMIREGNNWLVPYPKPVTDGTTE